MLRQTKPVFKRICPLRSATGAGQPLSALEAAMTDTASVEQTAPAMEQLA